MKHFNFTHLLHALWALALQAIIGLLSGDWWAGAAFGAAFFIGREHAHAELRWMEQTGTDWDEMPELAGLHRSVWRWPDHADGWLDWLVPVMTVVTVAICASLI